MVIFIIKSAVCLVAFFAFYKLLLEQEKMFVFNRFYLLGSLILSMIIPLITIEFQGEVISTAAFTETIVLMTEEVANKPSYYDLFLRFLPIIYSSISILFITRLAYNISKVLQQANHFTSKKWKDAKLVFITEKLLPHAFMNYIFINKIDFENGEIEEELLVHELQHVQQKHSYDIIFIEIIKAILWFNPLVFLFEKAIKLNHEFLADEGVIEKVKNIKRYQYLLLEKANYSVNHSYLASSINYLLTKKRLKMMTKKTSKIVALAKRGLAMCLAVLLCFTLSNKVIAQGAGASEKMIKEYEVLMKKYDFKKGKNIKIKKVEVERANEIYTQMSAKQRKKYPKINFPAPPPLPTDNTGVIPPPPPPPPIPSSVKENPPIPPTPEVIPKYYVDGKEVSYEVVKKISKNDIAEIYVKKKNSDTGEVHIKMKKN